MQFGARVDLGARAGSFSIAGFLSFDALVTLAPLAFVVDIAAKLAVKAGGRTLLSVSLALTLSGPRPWRARGRASFSILFFDVSFGFDVTIGDDCAARAPGPGRRRAAAAGRARRRARLDARQLPAGARRRSRCARSSRGRRCSPTRSRRCRSASASPRSSARSSASAPSVPSGAKRFRITLATIGGVRTTLTPLQDHFAPAQFTALSDDAKLSAPSFEEMTSGAALGADGYAHRRRRSPSASPTSSSWSPPPASPSPSRQRVPLPGDVFATLTATTPPGAARLRPPGRRMTSPALAAYTFLPWVQGGVGRSIAAPTSPAPRSPRA